MASTPLPAAFAHLGDEPNLAVEAALAEVLPHLEPAAQAAAVELLVQRAHTPTLVALITDFESLCDPLQNLLVAHADRLAAALRTAVSSPAFRQRAGAIRIIARSESVESAYLLADALRTKCPKTRELAALGMHEMTMRLLDSTPSPSTKPHSDELAARRKLLADALAKAIRLWETHFQPPVLESALCLADLLEPTILEKLEERRTKIARALREILAGAHDPRLAPAALRFLVVPTLRQAAARGISRAANPTFLRAVLAQAALLRDPQIERACRWIRGGRWVQETVRFLLADGHRNASAALTLLAASGEPHHRRAEAYRELIEHGPAEVRRAALDRLVRDHSQAATQLLSLLASRRETEVAKPATEELARRLGVATPMPASSAAPQADAAASSPFDDLWDDFDTMADGQRVRAAEALRAQVPRLTGILRRRLLSPNPIDRTRALRMISCLRLSTESAAVIYPLAHDPDPVVRACAVGLLAELPGATARRLLCLAVNDPDERVQASAIEALDTLDLADRIALTEPKLSSGNGRVRANAVKSLLRAEVPQAAETLLDMLEDKSAAHRLSALWVVERLMLQAAAHRVSALSDADPDDRVRKRARHVLERLTTQKGAAIGTRPSLPTPSPLPRVTGTAARLQESGLIAGILLFSRPQLKDAMEAIRDRFRGGGSIWVFLLAILALIAIVALTSYLTRRQGTREQDLRKADPLGLFRTLVAKLGLTAQQSRLLDAIVREVRPPQPAVILLSPALFERHLAAWESRHRTEVDGGPNSEDLAVTAELRRTLFPGS